MKKNSYLGFALLTAGLLTLNACSNETEQAITPPDTNKETTILHASIAGSADTRLAYEYEEGAMKVVWSEGDAFKLYTGQPEDTGSQFTLVSGGEGKSSATFEGTLPEGAAFPAFYPVMAGTMGDLMYNFSGQEQTGSGNTEHLSDLNYMSAMVTDPTKPISFNHLIAILRFHIKLDEASNETIESFTISIDSDAPNENNGFIVEIPFAGGETVHSSSMTLTLKESTTTSDGEFVAYMAVLGGTEINDNITLTVETTGGDTYSSAAIAATNVEYKKGKIYSNNAPILLTKQAAAEVPAIGAYYPIGSDATSAKGVVFWVADDESSYKVVAKEEGTGLTWGPNGVTGATDTEDGEGNMTKIIELGINQYPAFDYCNGLGGGVDWYLPASAEITTLVTSKGQLNPLIGAADGGTAIEANGYWSSTESSEEKAIECWFTSPVPEGKSSSSNVRCIKNVPLQ